MYFFLRQNLFDAGPFIELVGHSPTSAQFAWLDGVRFEADPSPLQFALDPAYGSAFPDFFDTTVPVMSARFRGLLLDLGLGDVLQTFPAALQHPAEPTPRSGYFAVNVVGVVDAVDRARSPHRLRFGEPSFTGPMVIDPAKVGARALFRLEHGPGFIVANAHVAEAVRAAGLAGVLVQPTEAYAGA